MDLKYNVFIAGSKVAVGSSAVLMDIPPLISNIAQLMNLLDVVHTKTLCVGNADANFGSIVESRNGKFLNRSGKIIIVCMHNYIASLQYIIYPCVHKDPLWGYNITAMTCMQVKQSL